MERVVRAAAVWFLCGPACLLSVPAVGGAQEESASSGRPPPVEAPSPGAPESERAPSGPQSAPPEGAGAAGTEGLQPPAAPGEAQPAVPQEEARRLLEVPVLEPVIVIAPSAKRAFEAPASTEVVTEDLIRERAYRTTPDIFRDIPGVLVQKTSPGQGSPYIRGFTGFHNVFLIDGVRLNNSVFRPGPNQFWNTVDPLSIERIEVLKGPASVLYGSDAIGGTVLAVTRSPYGYREGFGYAGTGYYRVSSAENSHVGRAELSLTLDDRLGFLGGGGGKHFGDLIGGEHIGKQSQVGYDEYDGDVKAEYRFGEHWRIVALHQRVRQNNVPRTHKTVFARSFAGTSVGKELRRELDQERELTYVQVHGEKLGGIIDALRANISWHRQETTRDRLRPGKNPGDPLRRDLQGVEIGTLGYWTYAETPTPVGRFTYGVDVYHDNVNSFSTRNPIQGEVADDATYDLIGVFVQDEIEVIERLTLTLGGRFNYARADAEKVSDPDTGAEISVEDSWNAFVGNARASYEIWRERVRLFGGVSQGFRAPNLSDLTRFDSARTNEFEIPAPGLDPERFLSYEAGVKARVEDLTLQFAAFFTDIEDQILRTPTGRTNEDGEFEVTKKNVGDGWIYGIELGAAYRFLEDFTAFGNLTYLEGEVDTFPTATGPKRSEYIDRLMPLTGQIGLRWDAPDRKLWIEGIVTLADKADRLSTRDKLDTSRIPPGGTPGYVVASVRAGYRFNEHIDCVLALENITDKDYRIHGSGTNEPGFNAVFTLRLTF